MSGAFSTLCLLTLWAGAGYECCSDLPDHLADCTAQLYAWLDDFYPVLPEAARTVADRMRTYDWLTSYQRVEAVGAAIDRMSVYRLRRANPLAGGIAVFIADPVGFAADFRSFLPDALSYAEDWRRQR